MARLPLKSDLVRGVARSAASRSGPTARSVVCRPARAKSTLFEARHSVKGVAVVRNADLARAGRISEAWSRPTRWRPTAAASCDDQVDRWLRHLDDNPFG